jgi:hypothetical protein
MSSPATNGPRTPKRHPACPGRGQCQLAGCIHSTMSRFSTDEISFDIYEGNGMLGTYPSIWFSTGGWLHRYQRLGVASEGTNVRGVTGESKETTGTTVYVAQTKIRGLYGIVLDRIRSFLNAEMPV